MKVLLINWSWYPTGGDWTYVKNLKSLYERNGYEVISMSTTNEKNETPETPSYFINTPDYKVLNKKKNVYNGIKAVKNSIVSFEALKTVEEIIKSHDIKIAHLNNIHHYITPAIIWKLKKAGIKVLWSLHDYKIICPENSFVSNGKICEKCITGNFYHCALNKCKKKSVAASSLAAFEAYFYHSTGVYHKVDAYLCPSKFIKTKFKQFGFEEHKLHVTNLCYEISLIDNFIEKERLKASTQNNESYILYVGRIEYIKGIFTLVESLRESNILLKIVGSGNAEDELKALLMNDRYRNVEFLGFQNKESVFSLTNNAVCTVCPSEWYENFPFSIIESFLFSKPVIGANIGGIPELIKNGETGLLFEPGNVDDLKQKINTLWNDRQMSFELGRTAKKYIHEIVNFKTHWSKIQAIIDNIPE